MKYAVVALKGKQYKVTEGMKLTVDRVDAKEGDNLAIQDVLLVADEKNSSIGTPNVDGATVNFAVVSHGRGVKIRVSTFKAKSRERKTIGHRQEETLLEVKSIVSK